MSRRVVITGLGTVNGLGNDPQEFFANLIANKSGIDKITRFQDQDLKVSLVSEIKNFEPTKFVSPRLLRRYDLVSVYAVYTAIQAHNDAGLDQFSFNPHRYATIFSTGAGGVATYEEEFIKSVKRKSFKYTSTMMLPKALPNMPSGNVAIELGAKGCNLCIITACATGTNSIGEAMNLIKHNKADLVITGAADACIIPTSLFGFSSIRALTTSSDPKRASIPFDKERSGFVMGEGSGALVLEELEHARARKAKIYAEVVGYGANCDAHHMTKSTVEGPALCIQQALDSAYLKASDIDYINAHGTSTPINDLNETKAIKEVFGKDSKVKISSTKSFIGHSLGAAGAIEAVACVMALQSGKVPGTINSNGDGEGCDLDYMIQGSEILNPQYIMSNSFGFGGHNATLIFKKWEDK